MAGGRWIEGDFVFTSSSGTPLDPPNVTRQFKALLMAAKCQTCGCTICDTPLRDAPPGAGVDPRTIMQTLGHSQISLTLNIYSHPLPARQQEAAPKDERDSDSSVCQTAFKRAEGPTRRREMDDH